MVSFVRSSSGDWGIEISGGTGPNLMQQEHWRMGPIRGIGAHRTWLPRVSVNRLHGITGLDELDPALYQRLARGD
jgi:hypothetical protein